MCGASSAIGVAVPVGVVLLELASTRQGWRVGCGQPARESDRVSVFHARVPDCLCGADRWVLVHASEGSAVARSWVRCSGCGEGRVFTVTARGWRSDELAEDVA